MSNFVKIRELVLKLQGGLAQGHGDIMSQHFHVEYVKGTLTDCSPANVVTQERSFNFHHLYGLDPLAWSNSELTYETINIVSKIQLCWRGPAAI
jgi:hypothetical protein